jgi:hypothetical protein
MMMAITVVVFLLRRLFHAHGNYKPRIKDTDFGKPVTKRNRIYLKSTVDE